MVHLEGKVSVSLSDFDRLRVLAEVTEKQMSGDKFVLKFDGWDYLIINDEELRLQIAKEIERCDAIVRRLERQKAELEQINKRHFVFWK